MKLAVYLTKNIIMKNVHKMMGSLKAKGMGRLQGRVNYNILDDAFRVLET